MSDWLKFREEEVSEGDEFWMEGTLVKQLLKSNPKATEKDAEELIQWAWDVSLDHALLENLLKGEISFTMKDKRPLCRW